MANEKHLLLTWGGDYVDAVNAGEVWQNGLRLVLSNDAMDPVGTLPNNWSPVAESINRTETNWTITGNWRADFGGGLFFNPDDFLDDQVAPALDTWLGQSGISNKIRLKWAKVFPIGSNGKAVPAPPYSAGTPILLSWTANYPWETTGPTSCLSRTPWSSRTARPRSVDGVAVGSSGRVCRRTSTLPAASSRRPSRGT